MRGQTLGTFLFDAPSQQEFARLSGDGNPIHVDPVHARRTQAAALTVHGVHVLCRGLEAIAQASPDLPVIRRLTARFAKPTFVDDHVSFVLVERTETRFRLEACVGDVVTMQLILDRASNIMDLPALPTDLVQTNPQAPREWSFPEIAEAKGRMGSGAAQDEIRGRFPAGSGWIGAQRLTALLCASRVVGMECPGLYSLLAGLDLELAEGAPSLDLSYLVVRTNPRLRTLKIAVEGLGVRGTVDIFVRHPPVQQLSFSAVAAHVDRSEFAGQRALVVGGSRGLGELTSKILAAGGGFPLLTYNVGREEAERVKAEITGAGGRCEVLHYDVRLPARTQISQLPTEIDSLYYYATCAIARRKSQVCDAALLDEFLQFYVHGFQELCLALSSCRNGRLSIFNPSSVFLDDRPKGMTEYAMAKAASEVLCRDLMRQHAGLKILVSRLPRLETDQTSSFVPGTFTSAVERLLPLIRQVQFCKPSA